MRTHRRLTLSTLPQSRWARVLCIALAVLVVQSILARVPVHAAPEEPVSLSAPQPDPVDTTPVAAQERPADLSQGAGVPLPEAEWPSGAEEVVLPNGNDDPRVAAPAPPARVRAGGLPVWLSNAAGGDRRGVRVEAVARDKTPPRFRDGLLLLVEPTEAAGAAREAAGASAKATVKVGIDYRAFAHAFGGAWSSRLRLEVVPACALAARAAPSCRTTPVESTNDLRAGVVSADVSLDLSGPMMLGLTAGADSAEGDFAASPLQPSSTWQAGGSSGAFNWSYPITTPPAVGGPAPVVAANYTSAAVDGRSEVTNNQPSWLGQGFELWPGGYIERRYDSCGQDMHSGANNETATGDLCWATDNAVVSLNGSSSELVKDDATGVWKQKRDDGSRVEWLSDDTNPADNTVNGAYHNEYWKVTTADGTQFFFGLNRLPGYTSGKPETQSVWTAPVAGNHSGERCHQSSFSSSFCTQAWRWNLDYVVDRQGNTMSFWYTPETNKYARNLTSSDDVTYVRGGTLDRIDYGTDKRSGTDTVYTSTAAPMQVVFTTADRCLTNCGDNANWPDTPMDLECTASTCNDYSPTFWTKKRLAQVTTKVWNASSSAYRNVDSWAFTHTFPDPGDSTARAMWLESIVHTGEAGTPITLPEVNFDWVQRPNRVDTVGDSKPPMNWMRISDIWTESGGRITVEYSEPECVPGVLMPTAAHTNTLRCYPVIQELPGGTLQTDYFHQYVVTKVTEADWTGGGPSVVTAYEYLGAPAWRYTDDDGITEDKFRTWSEFRGYEKVRTRVGAPGQETLTETTYLRGMHGSKDAPGGGTRTVVSSAIDVNGNGSTSDTEFDAPAVNDEDAFAGFVRATRTFNGVDTAPVSLSANQPWQSAATASRAMAGTTVTARHVGTSAAWQAVLLDGGRGWRVQKSTTSYDAYGLVEQINDLGDLGATNDQSCTIHTYNRNIALNILTTVGRTQTFSVSCGVTPSTEDDVVGDTRITYDHNSWSTPPTRGLVTTMEDLNSWTPGVGTPFIVSKQTSYDAYGRETSSTDIRDNTTTTTYTPAVGGPVVSVTMTGPLGTTTKVFDPAWQSVLSETDVNGRKTERSYNALGQLTGVWYATRPKASNPTAPSIAYEYIVRNSGGVNAVITRTRLQSGNYRTSYALYDGLLRPRQTQSMPAAGAGAILTETIYDQAGRVSTEIATHHDPSISPSANLAAIPLWQARSATVAEYDRAGRATASITMSSGQEKWRSTYSYGGDRVTVTPPDGGVVTTTVTDARDRKTEIRQLDDGVWKSTLYTYDSKGRLSTIAEDSGPTWTYHYDVLGRLVQLDDPDRGTTYSTYNDFGDLTSTTDARNEVVVHDYDTLGRRIGTYDDVKSTATRRATWVYDPTGAKGHLAYSSRWEGPARTIEYRVRVRGYTPLYKPTGYDYVIPSAETGLAGTYTTLFTYNDLGLPTTVSYPSGGGLGGEQLTVTYDPDTGTPEQLRTNWPGAGQYVTNTDYSALGSVGLLRYQTTSNGYVDRAFEYDDVTFALTRSTAVRQTSPQYVSDVHIEYDDAGNVTRLADTPLGGAADVQCFGYDGLRRLARAWTPASGDCAGAPTVGSLGGPAPYWRDWTFDTVGNRETQTTHLASGPVVATYAPNASAGPRSLGTVTTAGSAGSPVVNGYGSDVAGNITCRPASTSANDCASGVNSQALSWDAEGRLSDISTGGVTVQAHVYDADGNRLIQRDAAGKTLFLPNTEIRYTASTGVKAATRYYSYAGETVAMRTSAGLTWLLSDRQGTAVTAINANTQNVVSRQFDPYGVVRGSSPAFPNNKTFVGGDVTPSSLIHIGAREYDAIVGRFVSPDPVMSYFDPVQIHAYNYGKASPATYADPTGLKVIEDNDGLHRKDRTTRHNWAVKVAYFYLLIHVALQGGDPTKVSMEHTVPGGSKKGTGNAGRADLVWIDESTNTVWVWEVKSAGVGSQAATNDVNHYISHMRNDPQYAGMDIKPGFMIPGLAVVVPGPGTGSTVVVNGWSPGAILYQKTTPPPPPTPDPPPEPLPTPVPVPGPEPVPGQQPQQVPTTQPTPVGTPQPTPTPTQPPGYNPHPSTNWSIDWGLVLTVVVVVAVVGGAAAACGPAAAACGAGAAALVLGGAAATA